MKKTNDKENLPPLRSPDLAHDRFFKHDSPVICRRDRFTSDYSQEKHLHDFPQIWYCLSGECLHTVGKDTLTMRAGDLVIVPAGVAHAFRGVISAEFFSISISTEVFLETEAEPLSFYALLGAFADEITDKLSPVTHSLSRTSRETAEALISRLLSTPLPLSELIFETNKLFSLPELSLTEAEANLARRVLTRKVLPIIKAVKFINGHFSEGITTRELLSVSLLCQTSFFAIFKTFIGMRASYYIQRVRVSNAVLYLAHSGYDIAAVSDFCGFNSPSHLVLCHKKQTGLLPKYFRARLKEYYDKNPEFKRSIKF